MLLAPQAKDPIVRSYLTLRKAVGGVALVLPFAVAIPCWVFQSHLIESSISGYYYTATRNIFVGSLCAIAVFMFCTRGYDRKDEVAGILSSILAVGVAFCPTTPDCCATRWQQTVGVFHYTFAILLFSILAYFCLVLFKMSAKDRQVTRQKLQRNMIYTICGYAIIASMTMIAVFKLLAVLKLLEVTNLIGPLGVVFCFETTSLLAFGIAWLIKGETFLKDEKL